MKDVVEYALMADLLKTDHDDSEDEGFVTLFLPLFAIFVAILILNKLGMAPAEVWSFVKMVFFPATWDVQLEQDFSYLLTALLLAITLTVYFLVTWLLGAVFEFILGSVGKYSFLPTRIFHGFTYIAYKLTLYLFVLNLFVLLVRFAFYFTWGGLVWLAT